MPQCLNCGTPLEHDLFCRINRIKQYYISEQRVCDECFDEISRHMTYGKDGNGWKHDEHRKMERKYPKIFGYASYQKTSLELKTSIRRYCKLLKKYLPRPYIYKFSNGIALFPHLGIQWYKHTEIGSMKFKIDFTCIIFGMGLIWENK